MRPPEHHPHVGDRFPGLIAPLGYRWLRNRNRRPGWQWKSLAADARYDTSEKGRARAARANARYFATEKGRAAQARARTSETGRASQVRFHAAHPNYKFVYRLHETWARRAQRIEEHYAQASADA